MSSRSPQADRTRCKRLDELQRVSERGSRQDANVVAIHQMKVRRQPESPAHHRERIVAVAASPPWLQHRENNAPAADRSLIVKRSRRHRETRDSGSHPISVHIASHRRSESHRPAALPSVVWQVSAASYDMFRNACITGTHCSHARYAASQRQTLTEQRPNTRLSAICFGECRDETTNIIGT